MGKKLYQLAWGLAGLVIVLALAGNANYLALAEEKPDMGAKLESLGQELNKEKSGQIMIGSDFKTTGQKMVTLIFNIVITVSGAVFLIMLLVGGVMYLTGAGSEEVTGRAKRLMIDAVIGLILVLAAWPIGSFIIDKIK